MVERIPFLGVVQTKTSDRFGVEPQLERELFVYRRVGNAADIYLNRIETVMRPNSHHFVLYSFVDGTATGHIIGGPDGESKDVTVELVEGCVVSGALEFVIATLPLGETRSYKFPSLDTQSGKMENVRITVEGEEDLLVPAGTFATYKVRVKRAEGVQILYVRKELPHVIIKQEIPAQQLRIELKSLEM
ncbi:MAG: hypothetical protein IH969_00500 [Candidatus Krumholzibacteriota bacterium]|nr:hypothetical protein [Candidatus Krumholzibacteriota bacterium]